MPGPEIEPGTAAWKADIFATKPQMTHKYLIKNDKSNAFFKFRLHGQTLKAWNQFTLNSYQHQTTFF